MCSKSWCVACVLVRVALRLLCDCVACLFVLI